MYLRVYLVDRYIPNTYGSCWFLLAKIFEGFKNTAKYVEMVLFVLRLRFARKGELVHFCITRT